MSDPYKPLIVDTASLLIGISFIVVSHFYGFELAMLMGMFLTVYYTSQLYLQENL